MSFYKQIAVIVLFFLIQFLFFIPSNNNFTIILLKGISTGALILTFIHYAFPNILKSKKQNISDFDTQVISDHAKALSLNDSKYKKLVEQIIEGINSVNENYSAALYFINQKELSFEAQFAGKTAFKPMVPYENSFLNEILSKNEIKVENKKQDSSPFWTELIDKVNWRGSESLIGFPITYEKNVIGMLTVFIDHFSKINPSDKSIISTLVNILNQGISDIEDSEFKIRRQQNIDRIQSLYINFEPESEISNFLESVVGVARSVFTYDKMTICFDTLQPNELEVSISDGFNEDIDKNERFNAQNNIIGLSYIDNKLIEIQNWRSKFPEINRFDLKHDESVVFDMILSSPLRSEGKAIGNLTLERIDKPFSSMEVELIENLTAVVNKILTWINLHHSLNQSATRDGLTGLLNHKTFLERFEKEINRSDRFDHEMGLIFFDIDKFKSVNDTYGHLYGDYVLEEVSRIISKNVRSIDIVGRYGGEEFSVILVNTNIKDCIPLAEKIVKKIAKKTYLKDGVAVNLTISAGMSGYPAHSDSVKDLIAKADKAMYQTKLKGGNGVSIAE